MYNITKRVAIFERLIKYLVTKIRASALYLKKIPVDATSSKVLHASRSYVVGKKSFILSKTAKILLTVTGSCGEQDQLTVTGSCGEQDLKLCLVKDLSY